MAQAKIAATDDNFDASRATSSRKKGFMGLAAAIVIAAVGYGLWYYFVGSRYVSTDNAYSAAEVAEVTPSVTGIVQTVNVVDTQAVKQGDVLVQLDDTDARLALAQAEANLGQSRRRVSSYMATDEGLAAQVKAREADETQAQARLVAAQSDFTKAQVDLKRREALAKSGAVSGEELTNARNAMAQAESNLNVAKAAAAQATANRLSTIGAKKANAALTINATVETNPEVMLAKAKVEQAQVDLARTVIKAPVDGVIARRQVQVGQRVQNGERLMSVVPLHDVHVDANFKEVELRHVKIGQPVEVTADIYGDKVVYHGVVSGVSGGTGSAFSMIPAQNATGNWIKVVQRLPLRITLDKNELVKHPLQVGLSMIATIDTRKIKKLNTSDSEGLATARQD
ncbi:HlyD family secretion protein [Phytobacter diazotrophicus]|uniref:HlyD family secretion protein n=1 Tax=Phytobacter diazotrophicus TaxID=395631 RepID=UPI0028BEFFE8|nr:HlyD family secretion protein [Phytobacter diazotrophicus]